MDTLACTLIIVCTSVACFLGMIIFLFVYIKRTRKLRSHETTEKVQSEISDWKYNTSNGVTSEINSNPNFIKTGNCMSETSEFDCTIDKTTIGVSCLFTCWQFFIFDTWFLFNGVVVVVDNPINFRNTLLVFTKNFRCKLAKNKKGLKKVKNNIFKNSSCYTDNNLLADNFNLQPFADLFNKMNELSKYGCIMSVYKDKLFFALPAVEILSSALQKDNIGYAKKTLDQIKTNIDLWYKKVQIF